MTNRDFLNAVVSANLSEEISAKADELLKALDKKNDRRKETGTKTQKENNEIKAKILVAMQSEAIGTVDGYVTAKTVADYFDISTQKASPLLKQLVESGELVEKEKIKTKTGKAKGYILTEYAEENE